MSASRVDVSKRKVAIPSEYFSRLKDSCSSFESWLVVQPLQTAFTATTTPYKSVTELPNVNCRLSEIYLEAQITVTFSSNSGSDTYGTVQPTIIPYATSLIDQCRWLCGSTEIVNYRAVGTRYNMQQNLIGNSITRLAETYNNVSPVAYTAATAQIFRFPLTLFKNDFFSLETGIWPGQFSKKSLLEVYWAPPANVIYAAGTIVGSSFSFGYSVSGFNIQVIQVQDPNLDNLISTRGMVLNFLEPWWIQQTIPAAATQNIQIPIAFQSIRGIAWVVRKVSDLTSNTSATKMSLASSEVTNLVSLDLRINSQKRQNDVFVGVEQAIPETRRLFPLAMYSDFWTNLTNNQSTHQVLGMLAGQCYCTSCTSGLNATGVQSNMYLEFQLTSALSSPSVIDIFVYHDKAISWGPTAGGIGSLYIDE